MRSFPVKQRAGNRCTLCLCSMLHEACWRCKMPVITLRATSGNRVQRSNFGKHIQATRDAKTDLYTHTHAQRCNFWASAICSTPLQFYLYSHADWFINSPALLIFFNHLRTAFLPSRLEITASLSFMVSIKNFPQSCY